MNDSLTAPLPSAEQQTDQDSPFYVPEELRPFYGKRHPTEQETRQLVRELHDGSEEATVWSPPQDGSTLDTGWGESPIPAEATLRVVYRMWDEILHRWRLQEAAHASRMAAHRRERDKQKWTCPVCGKRTGGTGDYVEVRGTTRKVRVCDSCAPEVTYLEQVTYADRIDPERRARIEALLNGNRP